MRIWLSPSAYSPHKGGVESVVADLAAQLTLRGHDTLVVTNQHPVTLPEREVMDGVPVLRVAYPVFRGRPIVALRYPPAVNRVAKALASEPVPDLIHIHAVSNQALPLLHFARRRRIPVVVTTHGETVGDANHLYERSVLQRQVFRLVSRAAATLTAPSRWTADQAAKLHPRWRSAEVIPNGVALEEWVKLPEPPAEPVVFAWGRHEHQKGFDVLLGAWRRVQEVRPDARLILGGDGSETEALRRLATASVEFVGSLSLGQVRSHLTSARLVVAPSRVEAFGLVAVEALAARRSLIYSDVGGLAEATSGLGTSVPSERPDILARVIIEALSAHAQPDPDLSALERFDWQRVVAEYEAAYRGAVSG